MVIWKKHILSKKTTSYKDESMLYVREIVRGSKLVKDSKLRGDGKGIISHVRPCN